MRARLPSAVLGVLGALGLAFAFGGCAQPVPTSLDVTVIFDDTNHHPDHLGLTLVDGSSGVPQMATINVKETRALRSGDNFIVLVPDALDGQPAMLTLLAYEMGLPTLHGAGSATIARDQSVEVTVHLYLGGPVDGGVDSMVGSDGGTADLAGFDAARDFATPGVDPAGVDFLGVNNGPAPDVAQDVAATWDVGESFGVNLEPCAPVKRGNVALVADFAYKKVGSQSVRVDYQVTNYFQAVYPKGGNANWDLTTRSGLDVWVDAVEPANAQGWMPNSPTVILCGANGAYRRLDPAMNILPKVMSGFVELKIPLAGGAGWNRTDVNGFTIAKVNSIELHANPLKGGAIGTIRAWYDGVGFY